MVKPTCRRKPRCGYHIKFTGDNAHEFEALGVFQLSLRNGGLMLRTSFGDLFSTLLAGDVLLQGEDGLYRKLTGSEFESKYNLIGG